MVNKFSIIILLSICVIAGCDETRDRDKFKTFDSSKMNALSIGNQKYKQEFIHQLDKSSIDHVEMHILDGNLYIVTRRSDEEKVNAIYKKVIGEKPSRFSISPMSNTALNQIKILLDANDIEYSEGQFYGAQYIEWSPPDDKRARSIVDKVLGEAAE